MSGAGVSREGLEGVRPGREARTWSHESSRQDAAPHAHTGGSYYGRPIINPPVWEELDIAGYLYTGGLAGASSILAAGADLSGRPALAQRCRLCASGAIGASLVLLVHDLGRPARFMNMLRVFKPTSPMNMGAWLLGAYGPLNAIASASTILDRAPRAGRYAGIGAGVLGAGVASYTAALVSDTAVPAWHEGRRELPFLFVGSAAAAAGGFGVLAVPPSQAAPARRLAVLGAATELAAEKLMVRRLGMIAETLEQGKAGTRLKLAGALSLAGAAGAALLSRRSRPAGLLSGAALMAGSALARFALFEAGMASARDPRYTVEPQRMRMREAAAER